MLCKKVKFNSSINQRFYLYYKAYSTTFGRKFLMIINHLFSMTIILTIIK